MNPTALPFNQNALKILGMRYLQPDETPEGMLRRVSFGNDEYYAMMARLDFLPNSPTLFNAGTGMGTLSACFKFDVPDSMEGIMDVARKAALVLKWGGGVGYTLSELRPKGSPVKTTHKTAGGPVRFMRLYHAVAEAVTQGGKRDGAQMAILHCDHADIREFIHSKDNTNAIEAMAKQYDDKINGQPNPHANPELAAELRSSVLSTFNISVACTDEFMRLATDQNYCPEGMEERKAVCEELFKEMTYGAWDNGDPGCYFIDAAERGNPTPWAGKLTGTNPCGEVPLLDNEPCNLGSINLGNFVLPEYAPVAEFKVGVWRPTPESRVDWPRLESTVRLATCYLDDVLDHNEFPDEAITEAAMFTRKLGLGVMGWADMLALMHIHYDTDEAVQLGRSIMAAISGWARDESENLANEKGVAPCYERMPTLYDNDPPPTTVLRNATRTCIAPTGTISLLAGASSGIEPHFSHEWTRTMGDGTELQEKIPVIERCFPFVPKVANEIDWQWHVKHQAAFQESTDLACSKTINMPNSATPEDVYNAYKMMWELGCKGGTVFRDGSRNSQVLVSASSNGRTPALEAEDAGSTPATESNDYLVIDGLSGFWQQARENALAAVHKAEHEREQAAIADAARNTTEFTTARRKLPNDAQALRHKFTVGEIDGYLHVGLFPDGQPGELFVRISKEGSTISGLLETVGVLTSYLLQYGVPLDALCSKLTGMTFEPSGLTRNPRIPSAASLTDYIFRWLAQQFIPGAASPQAIGVVCPDCHKLTVVHQEGCLTCQNCGWSRC